MKRLAMVGSLCALMVAAQACSDDVTRVPAGDIGAGFTDTGGDEGPGQPDATPDEGPEPELPGDPDVVEPLGDPALAFEQATGDDQVTCQNTNTCTLWLSYSEKRTLSVIYTEGGTPVAGKLVRFQIEDDEEDLGKISALSTYTDDTGLASIQVESKKAQIGQFLVRAYMDNEEVAPLFFDVAITPKGQVPLTVVAEYNGTRPVAKYTVRLFRQQAGMPDCADVGDLYDNGTANMQSPITNLTQSVKFNEFLGLEDDGTQMYTVLAFSQNDQGAVLAWGCNDIDAEVQWGYAKTVSVELLDRPPLYQGTYEVTSRFDFVSALPESIQPYVYGVLDFFESPTGSVVVLACQLGGSISVLEDLCGFVFDDPENPNLDNLAATGAIIVDIIDAIINGLTKDTIWGTIIAGGKDIGQMLTAFEIHASITFKEEPNEAGEWNVDQTEESWHTVVVKWSLDQNCDPVTDEGCGLTNFSLNAIQTEAVLGSFSANVVDFWDLNIEMHPLNLNYGALINYLVEKQLLPQIAGDGSDGLPVIDSYEKFLQSILAGKECLQASFGKTCCEAFAENVIDNGGSTVANIIEGACDSLITAGADFLRDQLTGLTLGTGDTLQIGTAESCKFYDEDNDMVVDNFGSPAIPCLWAMDLDLFGATTTIDAEFWGIKAD